ncbi:ribosome biogenesis GTPase Der [Melioribacteraceae bacterium 4301-Me]|uniref:ribosome biogenesis GTPase Der n=1 Tax=Pyranulibacter aquaticus TaxID=3163344 RepID=UPI00359B2357
MKIPLVVIVGRPNVGKSTLFNRMTKTKKAIVDDVSGVTRDRIYGEVDWNGKIFRLIDTGGYIPNSDETFESAIREQIQIALEEADAIFFVVDGKAGLTPIDFEIASILRKSAKPIYTLVNKADTPQLESYKAEFYKLGLKNLYDVSALNGRNLGNLLDDLVKEIEFVEQKTEEKDVLKLAIIGRPNVGKSSLVNSLIGYDRSIVTDIPGTTRDSIDTVLKYYGEEIILVDTAGLRKKSKIKENIEFYSNVRTYKALWHSDVAVLLIDAQQGLDSQDQKIIQEAVRRRKGIILAVNKWDLIEKQTNTARFYEQSIYKKLGSFDYVPIIFVSALTKQRIFKIIDLAKKIYLERKKKIPTSQLNEIMLEEIKRNPPPTTPTGKEIKIKYVTQVGSHYPIFVFFANQHKYIPEHYKRFLEKKIRSHFGFEGVPITLSFREK